MLRRLALLLGAWAFLAGTTSAPAAGSMLFLGPTEILFRDADTVFVLRSLEWHSAAARHQEKLLRYSLRMTYWRNHLPPEMREVLDALGFPTGRLILTPVGHSEEWWYYGQLLPPLRFLDGALFDRDRFESYQSGRP